MTTDNDILNLATENLDQAAWQLHDDCCRVLGRIAELHEVTGTPPHKLERIRSRLAANLDSINATIEKIQRSRVRVAA